MQSRLQHGDKIKKREHPLPRSIPSMAAVYTTIGIGKRHTGQACVLGPLLVLITVAYLTPPKASHAYMMAPFLSVSLSRRVLRAKSSVSYGLTKAEIWRLGSGIALLGISSWRLR
jgi:hypothetical protein